MRILVISVLMYFPTLALGQSVLVDGRFAEWENLPVAYADASNDGGSSGIDFGRLWIMHDEKRVFLHVEVGTDILVQDENTVRLYIDTDLDAGTGLQVAGIGAELIWNFANRDGQVRLGGNTRTVRHADVGFVLSPTMTTSGFEMSFSREAEINGTPLFSSERMRVVLRVGEPGGDQLPDQDGGVGYDLSDEGQPLPEELIVPAPSPFRSRVLTMNTLQDGLLDNSRKAAFGRIIRAARPDILCFQECFDASAGQVLLVVRSVIDPPAGRTWRTLKIDQGNVLITHFDIVDSWDVQSSYRESAYLLRSPEGKQLLLLNCHFRCCDADDKRQEEADGVIAFLRDAKSPGGRITLDNDTPIMLVGDLNLVGERRQYQTLITGDIADNARYGEDEAPGWNGDQLSDYVSRQPRSPFAYTWYSPGSSYAPARLDYILYTARTLHITDGLIMNTADMSEPEILRNGLRAEDAGEASDHFARYAEFYWKDPSSVGAIPETTLITDVWPQPAQGILNIRTEAHTRSLHFRICDLLGRQIRSDFVDPYYTPHVISLDLSGFRAGMYILRIEDGSTTQSRTVVVQ